MLLRLIFFTFDINDDMKSSKRHVTFLSLIFLLKRVSKSILIKINLGMKKLTFAVRCSFTLNP